MPFADFGPDDLLVLRTSAGIELPAGDLGEGDRVLDAASRIVFDTTGLAVNPDRLLYVLESSGGVITFGVLCSVDELGDAAEAMRGDVVSLSSVDLDFEPMALREVLVEDLRSGFVRSVAHVIESSRDGQRSVHVIW